MRGREDWAPQSATSGGPSQGLGVDMGMPGYGHVRLMRRKRWLRYAVQELETEKCRVLITHDVFKQPLLDNLPLHAIEFTALFPFINKHLYERNMQEFITDQVTSVLTRPEWDRQGGTPQWARHGTLYLGPSSDNPPPNSLCNTMVSFDVFSRDHS
ncbi:hypothetical protein FPSE_07658 [Fusarium pseudograminearum CS3096]|uniref:Uncharacterized protein n=1 Tax=Fusarium pseudograminearum (strain CS3096) TaxID=1028729 RepID=K3UJN2_FUSPC|nr:hypothetical protein FPSE_07658 [Fusarium pseudograminearum CS3096]EKJ72171.1 hypothetical protein FPSE_07658 [Fusarium pseudograminearum CS3096]